MAQLDIEIWAVTMTDLSGVTSIDVSASKDDAVSAFMQYVYLMRHALPKESLIVVGDDVDAALIGLHLIWKHEGEPLALASVVKPASIETQRGYVAYSTNSKSFVDLADEMSTAISFRKDSLDPDEMNRLSHSSASRAVCMPLAERLLKSDAEIEHKKISQAKATRMWNAMSAVKVWKKMVATVRA